jgi:phosphate transport system protein
MATSRSAFHHQLQELRDDVVTMASMVDKAIARAVDALRTQDVQLAQTVVEGDRAINDLRWQGEDRALTLIATQGPMAADLRTVAASMQIFTDLERMGDHAAGIAKIVIYTANEPLLKPLVDIPQMAQIARSMLNSAITALLQRNVELAREISASDEQIDRLYDAVIRELLTFMRADPDTITRATHLLWAAHDIERIGDRVTNVCERVIFLVSGQFEEIDRPRSWRLSGAHSN